MVQVRKVGYRCTKRSFTKNISGEFAAILGGNGMGKSTALSIICSLNKPYRGKVEISPLNKNSFDTLVAVLPQNPQTLFLKTVLEDLYEVFDGRKISKEEKRKTGYRSGKAVQT